MSNNNMYDELATLFGLPEDDKRPRLFLHVFLNTVPGRSINRIVMHNDNWESKNLPDDGTRPEPEMGIFIDELVNSIDNLNRTAEVKEKHLAILNKYSHIRNIGMLATILMVTHNGKVYDKFQPFDINRASNLVLNHLYGNGYYQTSYYQRDLTNYARYRGKKVFTYKITKATAQAMLEEAKNAPTPVGTPSSFLASLDSNVTDTYFRDPKDPSKLFTKDQNGNIVEVTRGSKTFWEETNKNCAGFHVSNNDPSRCTEYLLDCINGGDPVQCRTYMSDASFWGNNEHSIKKEVTEMLPAMALTTLEKFGFKQVSSNDSVAKRVLNKVESVNSWLQRLEKEMASDPTNFNTIQKNTNLVLYLTLLVEKINGSPHILNPECAQSEETQKNNPNRHSGSYLSQIGLSTKMSGVSSVLSDIKKFGDMIRLYSVQLPTYGPFNILNIRQVGGGMEEEYKFTSIELENQYNLLKEMLKQHGKELDLSNDTELKSLFSNFKNTENKLVQTMKIMKKYIELMNTFEYNDPHKVLNLETLNEITKAHQHQLSKVSKKQNSLVETLEKLAQVLYSQLSKNQQIEPHNNNRFSHLN